MSMSDSIDRTTAIATLVMAKETGSLQCKELRGVIQVLNRMPPAQQWIPCSERLPEHTGTYLVTTTVAVDKYVTTGWYSTKGGWICEGCTEAWMPLPEPYKEEGNNSDKSGWDPLWDGR